MILFLDFDGVLHPEPCFDKDKLFICLPRLEKVLREFHSVQIVISSTWRLTRSLSDLRLFFSPDIAGRIIGVTPTWRDHEELDSIIGYQRHAEIEVWLRESKYPWQAWIAIDDKTYLFKPFLKNLIKTDSAIGFDHVTEHELRKRIFELM